MRRLLVAGALCLVSACAPAPTPVGPTSPAGFQGAELTRPYQLAEATLTDQNGRKVRLRETFTREVLVFYFGYTKCPDVCLGVLTDLASAVNRLPVQVRDKLQVIFITVDPARDTPEVLGEYLSRINPEFIGLTGPRSTIEAVAASMGVAIAGIEQRPDGGYEVNHTAQVIGFDADRRGVLVWTEGTSIGVFKSDLELLVRQQR